MVAFGGMQRVAATPQAGVALVNGTPAFLTWTAPNDGKNHDVLVFNSLSVTVAETGGLIQISFTAPSTAARQFPPFAGGAAIGDYYNFQSFTVKPGTTVTVAQASALTLGAAQYWADMWAN